MNFKNDSVILGQNCNNNYKTRKAITGYNFNLFALTVTKEFD
jgi:hypothetical protein